jgi:hypothetical protein
MIAVIYEPAPKLPLQGLKQPKQKIILSVTIMSLLSSLAASTNLVLVMIVYGMFSARGTTSAQTQINQNTLSADDINNIGGFVFGNTFGLGTVFISAAAVLTLIAVISTVRGLFVHRVEFKTIERTSSPNPFEKEQSPLPRHSISTYQDYDMSSKQEQESTISQYVNGYTAPPPQHAVQQQWNQGYIAPPPQQAQAFYGHPSQQPQYYNQYDQPQAYQAHSDLYSSHSDANYSQPNTDVSYRPVNKPYASRSSNTESSIAYQRDSELSYNPPDSPESYTQPITPFDKSHPNSDFYSPVKEPAYKQPSAYKQSAKETRYGDAPYHPPKERKWGPPKEEMSSKSDKKKSQFNPQDYEADDVYSDDEVVDYKAMSYNAIFGGANDKRQSEFM